MNAENIENKILFPRTSSIKLGYAYRFFYHLHRRTPHEDINLQVCAYCSHDVSNTARVMDHAVVICKSPPNQMSVAVPRLTRERQRDADAAGRPDG